MFVAAHSRQRNIDEEEQMTAKLKMQEDRRTIEREHDERRAEFQHRTIIKRLRERGVAYQATALQDAAGIGPRADAIISAAVSMKPATSSKAASKTAKRARRAAREKHFPEAHVLGNCAFWPGTRRVCCWTCATYCQYASQTDADLLGVPVQTVSLYKHVHPGTDRTSDRHGFGGSGEYVFNNVQTPGRGFGPYWPHYGQEVLGWSSKTHDGKGLPHGKRLKDIPFDDPAIWVTIVGKKGYGAVSYDAACLA